MKNFTKRISSKSTKIILTTIILLSAILIPSAQAINTEPLEESKNYIFSANDLKSQKVKDIYNLDNITIPKEYNLKDHIKVEVEDQKTLGLCQLFATMKTVETNYALRNGEFKNFSERYVDYMTSKAFKGQRKVGSLEKEGALDGSEDEGMTDGAVLNFLSLYGVALNDEIPYRDFDENEYDKIENAKIFAKINSTVEFPNMVDCKNEQEKNEYRKILKAHIMQYGGIDVGIIGPASGNFNYDTNAYYTGDLTDGYGHAICIVGWDDDFSKDNFEIKPEHDGAWIAVNSWSENWGDQGYFYIAYDDKYVQQESCGVLEVEKCEEEYKDKEYTYNEIFDYSNGGEYYASIEKEDTDKFFGTTFKKGKEKEYLKAIAVNSVIVKQKRLNMIKCAKYM